jgi:hypothetical protein
MPLSALCEVPADFTARLSAMGGLLYRLAADRAKRKSGQERTLCSATVALEEGASLATRLAEKFSPETRAELLEEAQEGNNHAGALQKAPNDRRPFSVE